MPSDRHPDYDLDTDEILGKYMATDEESAERHRLLNDEILGKYVRDDETPAEEPPRRTYGQTVSRRNAERKKAAALRRRRILRLFTCLLAVLAMAALGTWQLSRQPLSPTDLSDSEISAAEKELEKQAEAVTETPVPTAEPTPTETPEPTPTPDISRYNPADDWCLLLINTEHPLPDGYDPEIVLVENDQYTDARCYDALLKMLTDCRLQGLNPLVISGHRTHELQELYFQNMVDMYTASGEDPETARSHAAESVAIPGTSEHESGLSVDIGTTTNHDIDESQAEEPAQQWLNENCWKYGYIIRYPSDKSDITGIISEPWHYRYVGMTAAKIIHRENLCLEEYLEKYVEPERAKTAGENSSSGSSEADSASSGSSAEDSISAGSSPADSLSADSSAEDSEESSFSGFSEPDTETDYDYTEYSAVG